MLSEVKNKTIRKYQKGAEMAYKKPEVVAKSEAKESFVAGCPEKRPTLSSGCSYSNSFCYTGRLK